MFWISCALAGLSLHCLMWVLIKPAQAAKAAPDHVRHGGLRLVWPWVDVLARILAPSLSWRARKAFERRVQQAGMDGAWRPEHLAAAQLLAGLFGAAVCFVGAALLDLGVTRTVLPAVACTALAGWLPWRKLADMAARRHRRMQKEFPFLLDMTTLCVEAGLSLQGALNEAAHHGPEGPLRDELRRALADMRTGFTRHEALSLWAGRTGLAEVRQLVTALAQADQLGMSLGPLLRAQSEQRRNERFLRAEKLALEAPVKMLFPLVCCIFPCTFLIIGFPITVKLLEAM
ncbi:type II secretion system F family protein [Pusillimonas sp.]|uniref:type II secretion system F family protein n=1 Tax=Pusillimonas sp. TaxID=3040095 RepID=UPI0037CB3AB8